MIDGILLFVLLALALIAAAVGVTWYSYTTKDGRSAATNPETTIEERVAEIADKIAQIRKLESIAETQAGDPLIGDLLRKQGEIRRYLNEYLDKYEAQLLRIRYETILDACKHQDRIDEVVEAKGLIGIEKRNIESKSRASGHEALERQYAEILGEIDEIIKLSLITSTRNILAEESPLQRSAKLKSLDLSPTETGNASDDIESLNQAYDAFIAETQL